jgi:hypothetical protein
VIIDQWSEKATDFEIRTVPPMRREEAAWIGYGTFGTFPIKPARGCELVSSTVLITDH